MWGARVLGEAHDATLVDLGDARSAVAPALALMSRHDEIAPLVGTSSLQPTLVGRRYLRAHESVREPDSDEAWGDNLLHARPELPLVAGWICSFRLERGHADVRFDITGREHVAWSPFRC